MAPIYILIFNVHIIIICIILGWLIDNFRPKRGTLSINKAKRLLKYKPKYDLQKGIKKYIDFIKFLKNDISNKK